MTAGLPMMASMVLPMCAAMDWSRWAEPFQYGFMLQALGVAALIGMACAMLSCYLVLKGWALMGDAISHAVLPGVVLAYVVGAPLTLGAFVAGLFCASATGWIKARSRLKEDTVMGIVFTGLFALGLVMMTMVETDLHLNHIILGSLLGIHRGDLIQVVVTCVVVSAVVLVKRRDLMLLCFDLVQARAVGLRTTALYYLLLAMLAATAVAALQAVGIILTVAMLITPGSIGYLLTDRFGRMLAIACASAIFAAVGGTYVSYFLDGSTAGCIVLMQAGMFLLAVVFAPRHGLLARRRAVKAALRATAA